jgi:hypothetical protein
MAISVVIGKARFGFGLMRKGMLMAMLQCMSMSMSMSMSMLSAKEQN